MASPVSVGAKLAMAAADFPQLLAALDRLGYQMVGPTLRDGQLLYGDLAGVADLPVGWTDAQEPGVFSLQPRDDQALFGYGVGQQSWKQFLFPSRHLLGAPNATAKVFRLTRR